MRIKNFLIHLSKINWHLAYAAYVNVDYADSELPVMGRKELEAARDGLNTILVQLD